jgi:phospholipid/cholesterol/gamma-HCH transport system substrate-binding protein
VTLLAVVVGLFLSNYAARLGTYPLYVHFKDVKGLVVGADVQMSGLRIGKVTQMALTPSPQFPEKPVLVTLAIDRDVHLFVSDAFVIDQVGVLGDKFVSVQRPSEQELAAAGEARGSALVPGAQLSGGELVGFAAIGDQAGMLVANANQALQQITATYANPEIRADITTVMLTMKSASVQLSTISGGAMKLVNTLNRMFAANESSVNSIITNARASMVDVRQGVAQVNAMLHSVASGPVPEDLTVTVANIRQASDDLRVTAETARGLLANPDNQKRMEELIQNAVDASNNLKQISETIRQAAGDPQLQADLKTSLDNLRQVTDDLRSMTETSRQVLINKQNLQAIGTSIQNVETASQQGVEVAQKANLTLQRVTDTMNRLNGLASGFQPDVVTGRFLLEGGNRNHWRGDANFDLQYGLNPNSFWRVGERSVGDNGTINLQRAVGLTPRTYARIGFIGSRLGIALDYRATPRLTLEAEEWNPRNPQLDTRIIYRAMPHLEVTAGLSKTLQQNNPFVGLQAVFDWSAAQSH